jgi:hypothetical protein
MKLQRDLIGNNCDALGVRVIIAFKLVDSPGKLYERIRRSFVD